MTQTNLESLIFVYPAKLLDSNFIHVTPNNKKFILNIQYFGLHFYSFGDKLYNSS